MAVDATEDFKNVDSALAVVEFMDVNVSVGVPCWSW